MYTVDPNGKGGGFQINPEAAEFLQSIKTKVSVIAICGKNLKFKQMEASNITRQTVAIPFISIHICDRARHINKIQINNEKLYLFENMEKKFQFFENFTINLSNFSLGQLCFKNSHTNQILKQDPQYMLICGKYRTGKSYILNKLFIESLSQDRLKQGFQVGPTINPCTKGLWIWKELFHQPNPQKIHNYTQYCHRQQNCEKIQLNGDAESPPIIIIDTEGLGAFDEDDNHDTKIFLLALLLCSHLIYNSVGSIDENVLNNLSLVVNILIIYFGSQGCLGPKGVFFICKPLQAAPSSQHQFAWLILRRRRARRVLPFVHVGAEGLLALAD